ncbi:hypothetical protein OH77DRAFT_339697 [Trametes cingulata]|nr:hypothetical protein OH77DRAFT_339697 [Trametes cingulata]
MWRLRFGALPGLGTPGGAEGRGRSGELDGSGDVVPRLLQAAESSRCLALGQSQMLLNVEAPNNTKSAKVATILEEIREISEREGGWCPLECQAQRQCYETYTLRQEIAVVPAV